MRRIRLALTAFLLTACGDSPTEAPGEEPNNPHPPIPTYSIGGTVTGLVGTGLVLTMNGSNHITVGNGQFAFPNPFPDKLPYNVAVHTQPKNPDQGCTVANGSGTLGGAVSNIEVTCPPPEENPHLDPGFGSSGKATTGLESGATAMALQPDGRVVLVGGKQVARYLASGVVDASFGNGGVVTLTFHAERNELHAVALQSDGKILVAGTTRDGVNAPTGAEFAVARLNTDGGLDQTFGTGGKVITDFYSRDETAQRILVQPDGRIVVTGTVARTVNNLLDGEFGAARYLADGTLDITFGTVGRVVADVGGRVDIAYAGALQLDGKIVIGGRVANSGGANPDMGLVRLLSNGTLDASFGQGGIVRHATSHWDEIADLAIQADGRIVAVGHAQDGGNWRFLVARFTTSGALDATFGTAGITTSGQFGTTDMARAVALQPGGKIVVAGQSDGDFAVTRLLTSGAIDPTFGEAGKVTIDFFGSFDDAKAVAIQPNGAVIVAGEAKNGSQYGVGLARIQP